MPTRDNIMVTITIRIHNHETDTRIRADTQIKKHNSDNTNTQIHRSQNESNIANTSIDHIRSFQNMSTTNHVCP